MGEYMEALKNERGYFYLDESGKPAERYCKTTVGVQVTFLIDKVPQRIELECEL